MTDQIVHQLILGAMGVCAIAVIACLIMALRAAGETRARAWLGALSGWAQLVAICFGVVYAYKQFDVMQGQLDAMKSEAAQSDYRAYQVLLATQRPWIVIPDPPSAIETVSSNNQVVLNMAITFKSIGPSPATNGSVAGALLQSIDMAPSDFVRQVTNARPDCPIDVRKPNDWVVFNTLSASVQQVSVFGARSDLERSPYVVICARYQWSLDRNRDGRVIMLYKLEGDAASPRLNLLGSYAG
jgi:hypothetical protein